MAKPAYEREAKRLSPNDVQSAISYSQSAKIVGRIAEWRDLKTVGLTLRITPRQAVWYLRRRDITLRMGPASEIDLKTARYIADQTRLAAKKNRNLRVFVDTLVGMETDKSRPQDSWSWKMAEEIADDSSAWAQRKRIGDTGFTWTWKALTHHFLEYKKPQLKERYRKQYAHYLELDAFKTIAEKLVCEIKPSDLDHVRDQILIDHAPSAAHRAVQQGKVMLSWAYRYRTAKAGLDEVQSRWWEDRWAFEYHSSLLNTRPSV